MKNFNILIAGFILSLVLFLSACEKEYLAPITQEITTNVSFSANVLPILTTDCATNSSCHGSGGHSPELSADKAYDNLTGLGYTDTTDAEGSIVYKLIISTSGNKMPPNGNLAPEKIGYILAWIKQGTQNN